MRRQLLHNYEITVIAPSLPPSPPQINSLIIFNKRTILSQLNFEINTEIRWQRGGYNFSQTTELMRGLSVSSALRIKSRRQNSSGWFAYPSPAPALS